MEDITFADNDWDFGFTFCFGEDFIEDLNIGWEYFSDDYCFESVIIF